MDSQSLQMSVHDVTAVDEQDELDEVEEEALDSVESDSEPDADSEPEGMLLASVAEASGGPPVPMGSGVIGGSPTGGIGGH